MMTRKSRFGKVTMALAGGVWLMSAAANATQAQEASHLYEKSCTNCHGPSGKGDGKAGKMLKPPPADFASVLPGQADADIAKIIKEGGKAVGKSAMMPAFGAKLSDDQVNSLVAHVKDLSAK